MSKTSHEKGYKKRQMRILSGNPGPRQMYVPFGSPAAVRPASVAEIKAYEKELAEAGVEEFHGSAGAAREA